MRTMGLKPLESMSFAFLPQKKCLGDHYGKTKYGRGSYLMNEGLHHLRIEGCTHACQGGHPLPKV